MLIELNQPSPQTKRRTRGKPTQRSDDRRGLVRVKTTEGDVQIMDLPAVNNGFPSKAGQKLMLGR